MEDVSQTPVTPHWHSTQFYLEAIRFSWR